jgi:Zn-dependent protease
METLFSFPSLNILLYRLIALVIGFTVHEFAHAYTAWRFGDPTAKNEGRLTLNPLVHLDPIGTLLVFIVGFGWAKPTPVNPFHFRNRRGASVLVTAAGPLSNLIVAFLFMLFWFTFNFFGLFDAVPDQTFAFLQNMFNYLIYFNILLFVFNLIPLPPLDGYRIIKDLVPAETRVKMTQYEYIGPVIFLILSVTPLGNLVLGPLFNHAIPAIAHVMESVLHPLVSSKTYF